MVAKLVEVTRFWFVFVLRSLNKVEPIPDAVWVTKNLRLDAPGT